MCRMLASAVVFRAVIAAGCLAFSSLTWGSAAIAGGAGPWPGVIGNDTGGIIPWTPATHRSFLEIAVAHCARWHRYAGISSMHRAYGDYIGFVCVYDPHWDPRKAGLPPPQ